jgi:hypothetical protein
MAHPVKSILEVIRQVYRVSKGGRHGFERRGRRYRRLRVGRSTIAGVPGLIYEYVHVSRFQEPGLLTRLPQSMRVSFLERKQRLRPRRSFSFGVAFVMVLRGKGLSNVSDGSRRASCGRSMS